MTAQAYNHFISPGQRATWCAAIEAFGINPNDVSVSPAAIIPKITQHENGTATLEVDLLTRDADRNIALEPESNELVLRRLRVTVPVTDAIRVAVGGGAPETDGGAKNAGVWVTDEPAPSSPDRCVLCDAARAVPSVFCLRHGGTS